MIKSLLRTLSLGTMALVVCFFVFGSSAAANSNGDNLNLTPQQQQAIKQAKKETNYVREHWDTMYQPNQNHKENQKRTVSTFSGAIGGPGDILVTLDSASSSSFAWVGGHAALVYSTSKTIESFGNKGNKNGVRYWPNNWKTRYNDLKAMGVSGSTANEHLNAANYGSNQIGEPYNYNFFDVNEMMHFIVRSLYGPLGTNRGITLMTAELFGL